MEVPSSMKKWLTCSRNDSMWIYVGAAFVALILFVFDWTAQATNTSCAFRLKPNSRVRSVTTVAAGVFRSIRTPVSPRRSAFCSSDSTPFPVRIPD